MRNIMTRHEQSASAMHVHSTGESLEAHARDIVPLMLMLMFMLMLVLVLVLIAEIKW